MAALLRKLTLVGILGITACSASGTARPDSPGGQDKAEAGIVTYLGIF